MEKLIYVLEGGSVPLEERRARLAEAVAPAARAVGASQLALLIPDLTEEILERSAARIQPGFERVAATFECWLPSLDDAPRSRKRCGAAAAVPGCGATS